VLVYTRCGIEREREVWYRERERERERRGGWRGAWEDRGGYQEVLFFIFIFLFFFWNLTSTLVGRSFSGYGLLKICRVELCTELFYAIIPTLFLCFDIYYRAASLPSQASYAVLAEESLTRPGFLQTLPAHQQSS